MIDLFSDSGILLFGKMKIQKSSIWDRIFPNCASLLNSVTSVCPAHPSWRLLPPPDSESWWDRGSKTSLTPIHGHRRVNFPRTQISATHILLQIMDKWEWLVNKEVNQEILVFACLCYLPSCIYLCLCLCWQVKGETKARHGEQTNIVGVQSHNRHLH